MIKIKKIKMPIIAGFEGLENLVNYHLAAEERRLNKENKIEIVIYPEKNNSIEGIVIHKDKKLGFGITTNSGLSLPLLGKEIEATINMLLKL